MSTFVAGMDYLSLPRAPQTWVIKDLLPVSGKLNIYGPPKIGKSFAALGMALAVANGHPDWLGLPIETPGPVAYLQIDTPRSLWTAEYLEKILSHGHDISNIAFADSEIAPYPFDILGAGHLWIKSALEALIIDPPVMVIVDTLRDAHAGDENDSAVMRNVLTTLLASVRSVEPHPALVILSHQRKMGQDQVSNLMSDNRGSNYIAGNMDAIMRVEDKAVVFQSRSKGMTHIQTQREGCGLWRLAQDVPTTVARVIAEYAGASMSEIDLRIAQTLSVSESTAKKYRLDYVKLVKKTA
jgi:RecA-family ATPase